MNAYRFLPAVGLTFCIWASLIVQGQEIPAGPTFAAPASPRPPVAITGTPFGVLQAELPLPPNLGEETPRILVEDAEGRVFYPVVSVRHIEVVDTPPPPVIGRPGGLLDRVRSAVRGEPRRREVPVAISVSALFRGDGPLTLRLVGDINQQLQLEPRASSPGVSYAQLKSRWWEAYVRHAREVIAGDDFPKLIHKYLTSMLADRLELPRVDLDPPDPDKKELSQPLKTLALLAAIEPLREEILEDVLSYPGDTQAANLPVPAEPQWQSIPLPPVAGEVPTETLAQHVPPECFYLRFGSFANYIWFQDIAERHGGDITQSVLLRGFNYEASKRMERMLAAKMTTLAKMFGDRLISDMAVVGSDLYMKEGASLGILFQSTNPSLLASAMQADRKSAQSRNPSASLTDIVIAGKPVSLLSTPDNRLRSFYVQQGDYIFVSSSYTLVRRFLEVAAGDASLAETPEFRWARTWMPNSNDYAVFGYFSPAFFHRLVSPQYQLELRRRLEAIAHLEIAEVAEQVAEAEGLEDRSIPALQAAGLLPDWFDQRADRAQTLRSGDAWIDSLRGARGSFLPIADVSLESVSRREAESYAEIASFYQNEWRHMDPLLLGLRRFQAEGEKLEQVAVEAYIAPFEAEKYGWIARQLGAPTPVHIQMPADDMASVQLHVRGGNTLGIVSDDYHLFGGVKDMIPPDPEDTQGLIRTLQALQAIPGYIGAWPKPGIVEQLPLGLGLVRPDAAGFARLLGGLWRWQDGQFSLLSFDRSIIENAIPQLQIQQAEDLAQVRLRVADLTGSQLATWINRQWYQRAWRSSHGNAELLDAIHQQLKVPGPECRTEAERLLDVRLQCPLGGEYQFQPVPTGRASVGWWESTAWSNAQRDSRGQPLPPADYAAPWIDWFRGGQVHVTQGADSLSLVGNIRLELQPLSVKVESTPALPAMNFDLFGLPASFLAVVRRRPKRPQPNAVFNRNQPA